jgi:hypothetical protein
MKATMAIGDPARICRRCGERIDQQTVPVRVWDLEGHEWRYHQDCMGMREIKTDVDFTPTSDERAQTGAVVDTIPVTSDGL